MVAVRTEDVKSSCVDKMFTALDWKGKTIVINDTVNVFLGPSEVIYISCSNIQFHDFLNIVFIGQLKS